MKEFTQKHSLVFFYSTLIFFIATVVLGAMMVFHMGPRGFGSTRYIQGGMMQRNGMQMQGDYRHQMQGGSGQMQAEGTTTSPAPETN